MLEQTQSLVRNRGARVSPRRAASWLTVGLVHAIRCACLFAIAGCADAPQFASISETQQLMTPARDEISSLMKESFGTYAEPIAWERMPVQFHGAKAIARATGTAAATYVLDLEYQTSAIEPGQTVAIVDGDFVADASTSGTLRTVVDWDVTTSTVTFEEPIESAVGDIPLVIAPLANLKHGQSLHTHHCKSCHGATGAGDGPMSWSLNPKPRDYRDGVFKYTSTPAGRKASRADFERTLDHGIPGAYMPSYRLLSVTDKRSVIEYVRWLAMRGETEKDLAFVMSLDYGSDVLAEEENPQDLLDDFADYAEDGLEFDFEDAASFVVDKWNAAELPSGVVNPSTPQPTATAESLSRGRAIYTSTTAKCVSCHGESGAGNGPSTFDFHNDANGNPYPEVGFHDTWGNLAQPRNLLQGHWGGGNRPIDMYRRLAVGVKGTSMPGYAALLSEEELWDLTNYVLALPTNPLAGQ